jgi:outer membrane murein-binding lipoprotein Lpp
MTDFDTRLDKLEEKVQTLSKRVEDMEMEIDHVSSNGLFNKDAVDQAKDKLTQQIQDKPLQSMIVAIILTALIILLLK